MRYAGDGALDACAFVAMYATASTSASANTSLLIFISPPLVDSGGGPKPSPVLLVAVHDPAALATGRELCLRLGQSCRPGALPLLDLRAVVLARMRQAIADDPRALRALEGLLGLLASLAGVRDVHPLDAVLAYAQDEHMVAIHQLLLRLTLAARYGATSCS